MNPYVHIRNGKGFSFRLHQGPICHIKYNTARYIFVKINTYTQKHKTIKGNRRQGLQAGKPAGPWSLIFDNYSLSPDIPSHPLYLPGLGQIRGINPVACPHVKAGGILVSILPKRTSIISISIEATASTDAFASTSKALCFYFLSFSLSSPCGGNIRRRTESVGW